MKKHNKVMLTMFCLTIMAFATPSILFAGTHTISGVACSAYNNAQADLLERNHARLQNPITSPQTLWVLCPFERHWDEVSSPSPSFGWVVTYFQEGVTEEVTCIVREFDWKSVAVPGGSTDPGNTINTVAVPIAAPVTTPAVDYGYYYFPVDGSDDSYHYTIACKLPPGTGINQIGMYQQ